MAGNAKISITVDGGDLAADVLDKVSKAMRSAGQTTTEMGGASSEAKGHVETFTESVNKLGSSWVARITEGILLRDAIHDVIDKVKEGIMAFPELVEHTIKTGNAIYEMSLKTGASVENLSALRYVASQTGIDFDSFGNILFKMEQALGASGAKADEMQKHLSVLGLDMQTLKNEKPDQAFIDIMSALEEMPNRADQAAAGMAIFGKGFKEMAGLTQESITDLMDEAKDLGLVMSTDTAASAHTAEIGFKGFSMQLEAVGMEVASTVLPAVIALTKLVSGEFHSAIDDVGHPVVDLQAAIESAIMTGLDWASSGASVAQFLYVAWNEVKAAFNNVLGSIVAVGEGFVGLLNAAAQMAEKTPLIGSQFKGLGDSLQYTKDMLSMVKQNFYDVADGSHAATDKSGAFFDAIQHGVADIKDHFHEGFTKAGEEIADFAAKSHNSFGSVGADIEGGKEKVDKFGDAMEDLMSAGDSWQKTLDQIDGEVVEQAEAYLRAGVTATTLKTIYGLTETQVRALEAAEKERTQALKDDQKVHEAIVAFESKAYADFYAQKAKLDKQEADDTAKSVAETEKLWVDYYDRVDAATLRSTDYKKLKVQEWFDNEVLKLKDDDQNWNAHYDALYATAQQRMKEVTDQSDKYVQDTKKLLSDLTDGPGGWVDTFSSVLVHSGSFKDAVKGVWSELKGDTLNIFSDLLAGIIHSFLDELLHEVEAYVAQMLIKLAVLKAVSFFGAIFGFSGGGVVGGDGGEGGGEGFAKGGVVYAAGGWMQPQGTDTVPAMLTPGERVLTVQDTQTFERSGGLGALRGGQMGTAQGGLEGRIDALHATMKRQGDQLAALIQAQPQMLRHAMRGA